MPPRVSNNDHRHKRPATTCVTLATGYTFVQHCMNWLCSDIAGGGRALPLRNTSLMTGGRVSDDAGRRTPRYHFDRHTAEYRDRFDAVTEEMLRTCPIAWTDTYGGHWVVAGSSAVFELARCPHVSNDHDVLGERRGYKGISIPTMIDAENFRGGMLEMDDPEHRYYRSALNPYLSPAAVKRWEPFVDDVVRACIDEKIETGHIDFVDDLANVVPAVLTLAMLGVPLKKWTVYNEPAHASVYESHW